MTLDRKVMTEQNAMGAANQKMFSTTNRNIKDNGGRGRMQNTTRNKTLKSSSNEKD